MQSIKMTGEAPVEANNKMKEICNDNNFDQIHFQPARCEESIQQPYDSNTEFQTLNFGRAF